MQREKVSIHPSAEIHPEAKIGEGTKIWHQVQIRERASVGKNCNIGKGAYIDFDVKIGNNCKIQNGVFVYHGVTVEDGCLLGPGCMFLNDKYPRAVKADGTLKSDSDWTVSPSHIGYGASIGGGAVIAPGVKVGKWAIVGAGSVVTKDIPDFGIVYGNPARLYAFACMCGSKMVENKLGPDSVELKCLNCNRMNQVPIAAYESRQGIG